MMKKVLLLGDSIRMGYQDKVKELLSKECDVFFPKDNGRFVQYTYWQMNQMFRSYKHFEVVHFNNGYWDMNIEAPMTEPLNPLPEYLHGIQKIINYIKARGAVPIFANSAPIPQSGSSTDSTGISGSISYRNDWVLEYNRAAEELMVRNDVVVNDLYTALTAEPRCYKCLDGLHLTDSGYEICATKVAQAIRTAL